MDKHLSSLDHTPVTAPNNKGDRATYVAELRARYLNGSLDEVLIPKDAKVPDTLLQALFPHIFPEKVEKKSWKH
ncbi:MAG: hypothetical protein ACI9VR_000669 [Cognaticolwellia sp.]|jgi:hypothetical protein